MKSAFLDSRRAGEREGAEEKTLREVQLCVAFIAFAMLGRLENGKLFAKWVYDFPISIQLIDPSCV